MKNHGGIAFVLTCAACATIHGIATAADTQIALKDLPAPVLAMVATNSTGAEIAKVVKQGYRGNVSYLIEFDRDGHKFWDTFSPDGKLTMTQERIPFSQVSTAASAAIHRRAGDVQIKDVTRTMKAGTESYTATIPKDGKTFAVTVDQNGAILGDKEVPAAQ